MIKRVTRPQLKKLLQESGSVIVNIGNIHNGIFWSGCYRVEVSNMLNLLVGIVSYILGYKK